MGLPLSSSSRVRRVADLKRRIQRNLKATAALVRSGLRRDVEGNRYATTHAPILPRAIFCEILFDSVYFIMYPRSRILHQREREYYTLAESGSVVEPPLEESAVCCCRFTEPTEMRCAFGCVSGRWPSSAASRLLAASRLVATVGQLGLWGGTAGWHSGHRQP
jgi:hypothetical protein